MQEMINGANKSNIKAKDQCYFLKLEGNLKYEDVVGPDSLDNVTRREFLVRLKDIHDFLDEKVDRIKRIQEDSGATIAIVSSPEVKLFAQAHLELWGTLDQVKTAELLIVDAMTKSFQQKHHESVGPTMLMQTPVCRNEAYVPLKQATALLGKDNENVMEMEARSGAWIQVDKLVAPSKGCLWMKRLKIFGSRAQIYRVMVMVKEAVLEPYKPDRQESTNVEDWEWIEAVPGSPSSNPSTIRFE
ncbi:hypothetical protein SSX86_005659 [Deinandra increscens subsp. villosa]|uniref:Uncharacterized protein n=1 Tax=Deinandra increscens subsp. villosa TaxID=3103831 RepID=A0AAP0HAA1_9ASTR